MRLENVWAPRIGSALAAKVGRLARVLVISRLVFAGEMAVTAVFVITMFGAGRRPSGDWPLIVTILLVLTVFAAATYAIVCTAVLYRYGRRIGRLLESTGKEVGAAPIYNPRVFDIWANLHGLTKADFDDAVAMKGVPG